MRVLDWGCGRGRLVARLLAERMGPCGIDVDQEPLDDGLAYFLGHLPGGEARLRRLAPDGRAPFPDEFFDMMVSDNGPEHVAGLDAVLAEIARLTRPGGCGLHLFPARFTLRESHLTMPVVHRLPKGALRRGAIGLFTQMGIEPHWEAPVGLCAREKAATYFAYSRDKTFYRAPSRILASCARHGFEAWLVGLDHPRLARIGSLPGLSAGLLRTAAERLIADMKTVELFLKKPGSAGP